MAAAVGLVALLAAVTVWGALSGAGASKYGTPADSGPSSVNSQAVARGKASYMSTCIACHGEHGEARPGLGKDLSRSEFLDGLSDEEVLKFLMVGRGPSDPLNTTGVQMPPKGGNPALSSDDLKDIVAFVRSLKQQ
ncbi:MAG: cytochrome c [Phycisphaerales bacterium]|nr:cytochrome c [Phycisphaerales bacterium]